MARQERLFARKIPTLFLVDQLSLYRLAGSSELMGAQMEHLVATANRPRVTIQVVPAIMVPQVGHEIELTHAAAYGETSISGSVWTDEATYSSLARQFDSLRSEAWRASESLALISEAGELWTGGNLAIATATAGVA